MQLYALNTFTRGWALRQQINNLAATVPSASPAQMQGCLWPNQLLRGPDHRAGSGGLVSPGRTPVRSLVSSSSEQSPGPRRARGKGTEYALGPGVPICQSFQERNLVNFTKIPLSPDTSIRNVVLCIINCFSLAENHFLLLSLRSVTSGVL